MKRLCALALLFSLLVLPAGAVYADVSANDWYALAVDEVTYRGIMNGTSETTFSPSAPMSRGMLATVLNRVAGEPHSTAGLFFQDLEAGTWYIDSVIWCAEYGYMQGVDSTHFAPNLSLTREQLVTVLFRYSGVSAPGNTATTFADDAAISSWARGAVAWAARDGIINGKPGNLFDPKGTVTRAETCQVLLNYFIRFNIK